MNGALLVNKPQGISSFAVIEALQRARLEWLRKSDPKIKKSSLPKIGHGGTLDPFATGLLVVCIGRGVKLSRYFLDSDKTYAAQILFGIQTESGDPTTPIKNTSETLPKSLHEIQLAAHTFVKKDYFQTPPMHSAIKQNGKPLYELARQGIEVERKTRLQKIYSFEVDHYLAPYADARISCSSGTYIRTLAEDIAKNLGTLASLNQLKRTQSCSHSVESALSLDQLVELTRNGEDWNTLSCWVHFNDLLDHLPSIELEHQEEIDLVCGRQGNLPSVMARLSAAPAALSLPVVLRNADRLVAVARFENETWGLERVFPPGET